VAAEAVAPLQPLRAESRFLAVPSLLLRWTGRHGMLLPTVLQVRASGLQAAKQAQPAEQGQAMLLLCLRPRAASATCKQHMSGIEQTHRPASVYHAANTGAMLLPHCRHLGMLPQKGRGTHWSIGVGTGGPSVMMTGRGSPGGSWRRTVPVKVLSATQPSSHPPP
jgi:hypothetical protein